MDLDVTKLEEELQGIYQERQKVNERIRTYIPGRGRGRGLPGGPTEFGRGGALPGRGAPGRGFGFNNFTASQEPRAPATARGRDTGFPQVNHVSDRPARDSAYNARPSREQPQPSVRDRLGPRLASAISQDSKRQPASSAAAPIEAEAAGSKKRLRSAVVVEGQTLQPLQQDEEFVATKRPRADDSEFNPAVKTRNRRMFGFLNQTLQKCKQDSTAFRQSRVAKQRDEMLKRAEDHRKEDLVKVKAEFKREMASKRQAEVNTKRELNMQADVKRAEIAYVQKLVHRSRLALFIHTVAGPPLCWLPGKPSPATQALLEQEQIKLEAYKEEEILKVEAKRQQVKTAVAAMATALEAADARRREAALRPYKPPVIQSGPNAEAAPGTEGTEADAAAPMQTDEAEAAKDDEQIEDAEQMEDADADDLEDGAYVVLDEEDEDGDAEHDQQADAALPPGVSNGNSAEPVSTEDDRYVATAYDADEEQQRSAEDPSAAGIPNGAATKSTPETAADLPSDTVAALSSDIDSHEKATADTVMPEADVAIEAASPAKQP